MFVVLKGNRGVGCSKCEGARGASGENSRSFASAAVEVKENGWQCVEEC